MNTHNIGFHEEIRKISVYFWLKKKALSGNMITQFLFFTLGLYSLLSYLLAHPN